MTEREIFFAVLDLPDAADRAAYLDAACGNHTTLRAQVEALLRSHDAARDFLASPAVAPLGLDAAAIQALDANANSADGKSDDESLAFLAAPTRPDSLGRIGHYDVLEVLGRGAFGIVLRAFDEMLQRVVAVKVLAPQLAATSPARKRFLREARSFAKVRHENVVQVYAVEEQPLPYLVMEFIPGETLQQRLDRTGPLGLAEVLRIGRQIAEGLAAAHETGLIHRDIKPGNVLIEAGSHERVKITDFGLARTADDASMSQSGLVAGTPMFMAPEQAKGERIDHRADLYSLGSVLYTMSSGRPPFRANSTLAVLNRVAEDTPRPIPEIIPEVPQWLCDIIARLHAKNPEERFSSAREVADLLARCQGVTHDGAEKIVAFRSAKGPAFAERKPTHPAPPRKRLRAAAAAVLLVGLLGVGLSEATGVTNMHGTVIRLIYPEGTLVVEVDDPAVSVTVDGEDVVITGTGAKEIRLKPGQYRVLASKDGKMLREELVTVARNGRQVMRVSREPNAGRVDLAAADWTRSIAALPPTEQIKEIAARLTELNPDFAGPINPTIENGVVVGLQFSTERVIDISPVRALPGLRSLQVGSEVAKGKLSDLSPLRGMPLTHLDIMNTAVSDLTPLHGMPLAYLQCHGTLVSDLAPLEGMPMTSLACGLTQVTDLKPLTDLPLTTLNFDHNRVSDLSPLRGMKLADLSCGNSRVADLSPLNGMPLKRLVVRGSRVVDLSMLKGMPLREIACDFEAPRDAAILRAITPLEVINYKPAAEFWMDVDEK